MSNDNLTFFDEKKHVGGPTKKLIKDDMSIGWLFVNKCVEVRVGWKRWLKKKTEYFIPCTHCISRFWATKLRVRRDSSVSESFGQVFVTILSGYCNYLIRYITRSFILLLTLDWPSRTVGLGLLNLCIRISSVSVFVSFLTINCQFISLRKKNIWKKSQVFT